MCVSVFEVGNLDKRYSLTLYELESFSRGKGGVGVGVGVGGGCVSI